MSDLITVAALEGFSNTEFKNPQLKKATDDIRKIYLDAAVYATEKNREIAKILARVKVGKLYQEDGFDSVYDYAEKVFGIKKTNSYALSSAGEVYNNPSAPESLKAFSPSKLAVLASSDRKDVIDAIETGKISKDTTQNDLRAYVATLKPKKETKSKVIPTYTAIFSGSPWMIPENLTSRDNSMDEWEAILVPDDSYEYLKLPKESGSDIIRYLVISHGRFSGVLYVEYKKYIPIPKPAPTPVPQKPTRPLVDVASMSIEEIEAILEKKRALHTQQAVAVAKLNALKESAENSGKKEKKSKK